MKNVGHVIKANLHYISGKFLQLKKSILLIYIFVFLLTSIFPVLISLVERDIIDSLVQYVDKGENIKYQFIWNCLFLGFFFLVLAICNLLLQYIQNTKSLLYKKRAMIENVEKMSSLKMEHLDDINVHFLFDMSCEEANINPFAIITPSIKIVAICITAVSYYIILFRLNALFAMLPLLIAIPFVIIGKRKEVLDFQVKYDQSIMELNRRISYFTFVIKEPLYAKENIVYNVGNFFIKKRRNYKDDLIDKKLVFIKKSVCFTILLTMIVAVAQYGVYLLMGYNVLGGNISLGNLSLYFNAFSAILLSLSNVIDSVTYIDAQMCLNDKRKAFLALPIYTSQRNGQDISSKKKHRIVFDNVTFAYPNTNRNIIQNLSFTIECDDIIALIGENGSGKSTLIKLLIGQYEPQEGSILIDGIDIKCYAQNQLTEIFGVMFQEVAHVAISIREFVTLSENDYDRSRFQSAIANAGCSKVIKNAVAHEETIMGLNFEKKNAQEFSGGEWQRLALARLFYMNPDIYIMDEPTASFDAEAEYEFFKNIMTIGDKHNIIMVSHRLSIAKLCTKIMYFGEEGVMVGTHQQMMKVSEYRELYELQKKMYFG